MVLLLWVSIAAVILCGRTLAPLTQLATALTRVNTARTAFRSINDLMKNLEIVMKRNPLSSLLSREKLNLKM